MGWRTSGAEFAAFAADVAARCRIIVIAVYDGAQADRIAARPRQCDARRRSSSAPPPARRARCRRSPTSLTRSRLALIEAPISGTSAEVRAGTATALVAGEAGHHRSRRGDARHPLPAADQCRRDRQCEPHQARHQPDPAEQPRGARRGPRLCREPRPRRCELPCDGAAIGGIFQGDGQQGTEDAGADFSPQSHIAQTLKDAELILQEADRHGLRVAADIGAG